MDIEKKKSKLLNQTYTFTDGNGNKIEPPVEGSLGLLALGYRGIMSWKQVIRKSKEEND